MKAYLLIGALVFGASFPAFAADAVVDEVVVVDSAYDWSGVYVGVVAGAAWGDPDYNYNFEDASESTGIDIDGAFGGLTAGYNFQFGNFVAGIEGDISVADINGSALGETFPCVDEGCTLDLNWFGTGRLRSGYAFDRFLPYVTGGVAFGDVEGTADLGSCADDFSADSCFFDETRIGWTIGAGGEFAFNANWSIKAEYLYVNLGKPDFNNIPGLGGVSSDDIDFSTARVGLNYNF